MRTAARAGSIAVITAPHARRNLVGMALALCMAPAPSITSSLHFQMNNPIAFKIIATTAVAWRLASSNANAATK